MAKPVAASSVSALGRQRRRTAGASAPPACYYLSYRSSCRGAGDPFGVPGPARAAAATTTAARRRRIGWQRPDYFRAFPSLISRCGTTPSIGAASGEAPRGHRSAAFEIGRQIRIRNVRYSSSSFFAGTDSAADREPSKPPESPSRSAISPRRLYRYLRLSTFQESEIEQRFDDIAACRAVPDDSDGNAALAAGAAGGEKEGQVAVVGIENLQAYLVARIRQLEDENKNVYVAVSRGEEEAKGGDGNVVDDLRRAFAAVETRRIMDVLLGDQDGAGEGEKGVRQTRRAVLSKPQFVERVRSIATQVDLKRALPITFSMLLVGSSVGIITPAMPFIVADLGLSHSQFGMVVSAFALSKMLGNVPSAIGVERHGRKPYMTYSLGVIALATAGIGLSGSFEELYICRFLAGNAYLT